MSDGNQKSKHVHSNIYQLRTPTRPSDSPASRPSKVSQVIQTGKLNSSFVNPKSIIPKSQAQAVDGLKQNLKTLNDLQARLRFMLTELEDLIQGS